MVVATIVAVVVIVISFVASKSTSSSSVTTPSPTSTRTPSPTPGLSGSIVVSTIADGFATAPLTGMAVSRFGYAYVSNQNSIYRLQETDSRLKSINLWAGGYLSGDQNGFGTSAQFNNIRGLTVDGSGNILVADDGNYKVRIVDSGSAWVSDLCGAGSYGYYNGDAYSSLFRSVYGLAIDASSNVYIADYVSGEVRRLSTYSQIVSSFVGVQSVTNIAIASNGDFYFARENSIYKSTPGSSGSWIVAGAYSNIAGTRDGHSTDALFDNIGGLAFSPSDELYISDSGNHCIRKMNILTGDVTTVAGHCGVSGSTDGEASLSRFQYPGSIVFSSSGTLYVAEGGYMFARLRVLAFN